MGFSTVFFIFLIFLAVRSSRFSIDIPFRFFIKLTLNEQSLRALA